MDLLNLFEKEISKLKECTFKDEKEYEYLEELSKSIVSQNDILDFSNFDILKLIVYSNKKTVSYSKISCLFDCINKECINNLDFDDLLTFIDETLVLRDFEVLDFVINRKSINIVSILVLLKRIKEIDTEQKMKIVDMTMNYENKGLDIFKDETIFLDFINVLADCEEEIVNDYIRINNFKINYDSILFSKSKEYKRMSKLYNLLGAKVQFETVDGEIQEVDDVLKASDISPILSKISDKHLMLRKNRQEFQKSVNKKISLYQSIIELIKKINPNEMINIPENILSKLDYDLFEVFIKYILEHNRNIFSTLEVENIRKDNYDKLEKVFLKNNISIQQLSLDEKNKLLMNGNLDKIDNILKTLSTDLWSWISVSNPNFTNVILYSNTEILNYLAECIKNGIITKENVQTHIGILFDDSFKDGEIKPLFDIFKNNIEILNRVLPNLDKRFKNNVEVLFVETSYLENILKLIKKYNLNLKSENAKMYPLEIINHLSNFDDLDSFIELGFKDYIIENPQFLRHDSKNILTRLSIVVNIGLDPMSKENRLKPSITNGKNFYVENKELEKYRELKVDEYTENEYFDILKNNERIKIEFIEQEDIVTYFDKLFLKNELEYEINGIIISRLKFLRNLECLMNKTDSYDTNAIFASLVYNSILDNETIEYITQILKDFGKEYKGMSKSFTNN